MPSGPRRITLCADDYGLHEGVDRGIVSLAVAGLLDAVSCMTRSPRWHAVAPALLDLPAGVETGVHLNLTEIGASSAGDFCRPLPQVLLGSFARVLPRRQIRATIDRHLDAFEAALGRPPDYVDGHRHVHQFPGVIDELATALSCRYPPQTLPWLRATDPPAGLSSTKARVIVATRSWRWRSILERHRLRCNPAFIGVYDLTPDRPRYLAAIERGLEAAVDGTLMMCHPALGESPPGDTIAAARAMEHEILSSATWPRMLACTGCVAGVSASSSAEVARG